MRKNNKQPFKKNMKMLNSYKQSIKKIDVESEDTIDNNMVNLECSDIPSEIDADNIPIQKKGRLLQIKDWLNSNWVEFILFGALVVLMNWGVEAKVNIAKIDEKLNYIEQTVSKLDETYPRKNEIEIEIENIKKIIDRGEYYNIDTIMQKVDELEKRVDEMK